MKNQLIIFLCAFVDFGRGISQDEIWKAIPTTIDKWPSMVSVLIQEDNPSTEFDEWTFHCAGMIITSFHVLTSGWCVKMLLERDVAAKNVIVRGNTEFWKWSCGRRRIHAIAGYILHDDFKEGSPYNPTIFYKNDIGILTVVEEFLGLYETPKSYNTGTYFWESGKKTTAVIGWDTTYGGDDEKERLRSTYLDIYSKNKCDDFYRQQLPPHTYCASFGKYKKGGPCAYDTGSPQFGILGSKHVLIGVVSTGVDCTKKPPVITNVTVFAKWIHRKIKKDTMAHYWY